MDAASTPHAAIKSSGRDTRGDADFPIRSGRDVRASDTRQSESMSSSTNARAPGVARPGSPGSASPQDERQPWSRVVGVVGDIRISARRSRPARDLPGGFQNSFPFMAFVVRTARAVLDRAVHPSRGRGARSQPAAPGLRTMDEHVERALSKPKFFSTLVTSFGLLAVTLALIGSTR